MTRPPRTSPAPSRRAAGRALRAGVAAAWASLVWVLLTWPPPASAPQLEAWLPWPFTLVADKAGHALLFLVQTVLAWLALRREGAPGGVPLAAAALLALSYGAATELRQRAVPGRQADVWDFAADGGGVLAAVAGLRLSGARGRHSREWVAGDAERGESRPPRR